MRCLRRAVLPVLILLLVTAATPGAAFSATLARESTHLQLSPTAGPPGSPVGILGVGCSGGAALTVSFDRQTVGTTTADPSGGFATTVTIPLAAVSGAGTISVVGPGCRESASFSAQEGVVGDGGATKTPAGIGPWEVAAGLAVLGAVLVLAIRRRRAANGAAHPGAEG